MAPLVQIDDLGGMVVDGTQKALKDLKTRNAFKHIKPRVDTWWSRLPAVVLATRGGASPRAAQRVFLFWRRMIPSAKRIYNIVRGSSEEEANEGPYRLERKPGTMFRAASTESLLSASKTRPESVRVDPRERDNAMAATMPTAATNEPGEEESTIRHMKTVIERIVENNLHPLPAKEKHDLLRISKYLIEHGLVDENLASYKPLDIASASIFLALCLQGGMKVDHGLQSSLYSQVSERMLSITREIAGLPKDSQQDEGLTLRKIFTLQRVPIIVYFILIIFVFLFRGSLFPFL